MFWQRNAGTLSRLGDSLSPTRREVAHALAALGSLAVLVINPAEGGAKKGKKKCKHCKTCHRCKKGKCKPQPDGTACAHGNQCQSGACTCDRSAPNTSCPDGCFCSEPDNGAPPTCVDTTKVPVVLTCDDCPAGTVTCQLIPVPDSFGCYQHCGA